VLDVLGQLFDLRPGPALVEQHHGAAVQLGALHRAGGGLLVGALDAVADPLHGREHQWDQHPLAGARAVEDQKRGVVEDVGLAVPQVGVDAVVDELGQLAGERVERPHRLVVGTSQRALVVGEGAHEGD
jgi:hypothetical protein